MKLDKPISIQVFFSNDKTFKYYNVTYLTRKDGLITVRHGQNQELAILVEQNVNQIVEV